MLQFVLKIHFQLAVKSDVNGSAWRRSLEKVRDICIAIILPPICHIPPSVFPNVYCFVHSLAEDKDVCLAVYPFCHIFLLRLVLEAHHLLT